MERTCQLITSIYFDFIVVIITHEKCSSILVHSSKHRNIRVILFSFFFNLFNLIYYLHIRLGEAMTTLFWALFGLPDISVVDFTAAVDADHFFTETVGNLLYATYHVIAIVVLLNVLIAMMSNTYTRVEVSPYVILCHAILLPRMVEGI